jgi:hypothetical protein
MLKHLRQVEQDISAAAAVSEKKEMPMSSQLIPKG